MPVGLVFKFFGLAIFLGREEESDETYPSTAWYPDETCTHLPPGLTGKFCTLVLLSAFQTACFPKRLAQQFYSCSCEMLQEFCSTVLPADTIQKDVQRRKGKAKDLRDTFRMSHCISRKISLRQHRKC